MFSIRYAPLALLLASALISLDVRSALAQSFVFRDDFGENEEGSRPLSGEWTVVLGDWFEEDGFAQNEGEATADIVSITFPRTGTVQYAIETRFSVPNTEFFFGSEVPSGLQGYRLAYGVPFSGPPTLNLSRVNNDRSVSLGGAVVAEVPTPLGEDFIGVRVLRDGETGVIEVYVDQGVGFGQKPLIRALDATHPALGYFGYRVDGEPAREGFVDYFQESFIGDPLIPSEPLPTVLIADVEAASGADYRRGILSADYYALPAEYPDERLYTDRNYAITAIPFSLQNAFFIQTANNDKAATAEDFLRFTLTEPATVYVGYDPRATALPAWLSDWTRTGDVVRTEDPDIVGLDVYAKTFDAGTVTLGGNLAAPAAGAESNYLVAAAVGTPYVSSISEAERAELAGPVVATNHPFFTGGGFADYRNPSGDYAEWEVFASQDFRHALGFRYALAGGNRPLEIRVNGEVVEPELAFPATSGWDRWGTARLVTQLDPGLNTVRATAVGASGPNLDALLLDDPSLTGTRVAEAAPEVSGEPLAEEVHQDASPEAFRLEENWPDPFNPSTEIRFALPQASDVQLAVYDLLGREVARLVSGPLGAGQHTVRFDASALASGMYLYRIEAGAFTETRRMTLLK